MAFHKKAANTDAILIDLDGEYLDPPETKEEDKTYRFHKGVAKFNDGTELKFPPEVLFSPDNHEEGGRIIALRLRVQPEKGPSFLIPERCSKQYIMTALERLAKGV